MGGIAHDVWFSATGRFLDDQTSASMSTPVILLHLQEIEYLPYASGGILKLHFHRHVEDRYCVNHETSGPPRNN